MSALKAIEIKKRKTVRTVMVPDYGESTWRDTAAIYSAKHYRFEDRRTVYRRGQLTIVFDLSGKPIEGYSYWTCIFCYTEPSADFPSGRLIYNASGYGSTTGKHIGDMRAYFGNAPGTYAGKVQTVSYSRVQAHVRTEHHDAYTWEGGDGTTHTQPAWDHEITRSTKAYTSEVKLAPFDVDSLTCDQVCWGRGTSPSEMRDEAATGNHSRRMAKEAAEMKAYWAQARAERAEREATERAEAHAAGLADGSVIALKVGA